MSWQDNDRIVLTRNDNYWQEGKPYLDGMVLRVITEQATGLRSVIAGENDFAINIDIQSKAIADRAENLCVKLAPSMFFWGAYLNYRPAAVRQCQGPAGAVLGHRPRRDEQGDCARPRHARQWRAAEAALGLRSRDRSTCTPTHPDKARALLAEAGHPDGIDIPVLGWSDQSSMQRQEVAVSQLAKAGIRLQLTPGSPQETAIQFFGPTKKGASRLSGMGGFADPAQQYDNLFSKDSFYNASGIELPGYRELINASQAAADRDRTARRSSPSCSASSSRTRWC